MEKKTSYKLKINVIIIDPSNDLRASLTQLLSGSGSIEVAAEAPDAERVRRQLSGSNIPVNAAVIGVSPDRPENAALIKELAEKFSIPSIAMYSADNNPPENIPSADFIKKPVHRSDITTFSSLLITKIILAAKSAMNNTGSLHSAEKDKETAAPVAEHTVKKGKPQPELPSYEEISGLSKRSQEGYVVALGASTSGTDALECIIKTFPKTMPPVLVVQHMPPVFTKLYSDRLDRSCQMHVKEAQDGDRLSQGLCLIAAGGLHMELKKDANGYFVKCDRKEKVSGHCPSVDVLFSSVAETAKNKALGALMTGMGADGAKGLLRMLRSGAYTIGQDKESCVVYGMPMEAYKLGACSEQLSLASIGRVICRRLTEGWK